MSSSGFVLDSNRVPSSRVFRLIGFPSPQAMDHARRAMQMIEDPITGALTPYPSFRRLFPNESPGEIRRREVELEAVSILVVPTWGGRKYPRASWTYDLARCEMIGRGRSEP